MTDGNLYMVVDTIFKKQISSPGVGNGVGLDLIAQFWSLRGEKQRGFIIVAWSLCAPQRARYLKERFLPSFFFIEIHC